MVGRYKSMPFASSVSFDVNDYVVHKALDGLFHVICPAGEGDPDQPCSAGHGPSEGRVWPRRLAPNESGEALASPEVKLERQKSLDLST